MAVSTCQPIISFQTLTAERFSETELKFGIQADFTNNINVESVDEVNPLNRFEIL